ncbi:hypothetical protein BSL78_15398 [Apostichopus japonicus]|uniref:DUF4604 domain-containing protein n=1 Tax=Stichopus japonicus TaxID=307972 RepID=A0A2G8KIB6_STIJA|nr:hypothetical protein BSL78_15398 [Apostichopus japonicus]
MAGRGRQGVDYMKPKEPSFLTKFKREIGYKEGPTVNSKKANLPLDEDDDRPDADDEQPLVVVLKDGDLTKDEYEKHKTEKNDKTGDSDTSSSSLPGKLSFQKPSKRTNQESPGVQFGSSKKKKDKEKSKQQSSKQSSKSKKVKNESLLSFADEDDDDEET